MPVYIVEDIFGSTEDPFTKKVETIKRFTFTNDGNVRIQVISLGATITVMEVPDDTGHMVDVALGYDNVEGYQSANNPYFGTAVGRVCNRIGYGTFPLNGKQINVNKNFFNKHQLHGGFIGFNKAVWHATKNNNDDVIMTHISPDNHEGYPGEVTATCIFKLTEDNKFFVKFNATTNKTTVVNLTNHSYFNLAGHDAGPQEIYDHFIQINADKITETDEDSIPTGKLLDVTGTPYDLREIGRLGSRLEKTPQNAFDDNFCINDNGDRLKFVAKACHTKSGRVLEIFSDQPGVQFYTSNSMPDLVKGELPILGKGKAQYIKHGAFCLETQKYPDAPNHPNFPSIVLNPGELYTHEVMFKFGTSSDYTVE